MNRRSIRRLVRSLPPVAAVVVVLVILVGQQTGLIKIAGEQVQNLEAGTYRVSGFSDGDTILVDMKGSEETIRFIGVDTPETHDPRKAVQCFGKAAAEFTKNLISSHPVRLEADPLNTNRDRYNRLLRYVYLPDGTLVNAEIIRQGYGFAYLGFPFTKSEEFRLLQQEAREQNRGLWSACEPAENEYGGYTSNDE